MIGAVIAGLSLCIGIIFFIIGGATVRIARSTQYLFLIGLGGAFFVAAMIIFVVSSCVIQSKMVTRLQQAIAQESAKYSQRSPKPCSWRLDTTRTTTGYNNNRRTYVSYHVSSISPVAETVTCWLCPDSPRSSSTLAMRLLRCMAVAGSHQRPTFRATQHRPRTVKPREHFVVNVACHCRIRMPNSVHRVVIHSTSTRTRSQAYPMNETPCNKLQFLSRFGK